MAPREKTNKATTLWSTHDNACAHCRERKIRCGRERPRCTNCKRDGVECGYSTPGKRVNHIKLLCNNVGGLEDRLSNIETELSFMNTLLKSNRGRRSSIETTTEDECSTPCSIHDSLDENKASLPSMDRHMFPRSSKLTDPYHSPCTLVALCHEFCDTLLSSHHTAAGEISAKTHTPAIREAAQRLIDQVCLKEGIEGSIDLNADPISIQLPPKQLLLMAQSQFFRRVDYSTDLFDQSIFRSNVERVYSMPFESTDEAWAICFNVMILLALGPESTADQCDSRAETAFAQPLFSTVCSALSNPRLLLAAKMINVQALALLSIAAQTYYSLAFAESIFAQACVLARMMGLHQVRSAPEGVSPEALERYKVFKSLYLRDKSSMILRGSICWLSSGDSRLWLEADANRPVDHKSAARTQLSRLEDDSYQLSLSKDSPGRSSAKYQSELLRIERRLEHWANVNEIFCSPYASNCDIDLKLEFLATRIHLLRKSPEPNHILQTLNDSRASCLLVIISYDKHEKAMIEQLDILLHSKSPSKLLGRQHYGRSSKSSKGFLSESARRSTISISSQPQKLLDTFSLPAFFLLATNVLWPSLAYDESKVEQDLNLLQRTCACFKESGDKTQTNNHIRKVGQTFEGLLGVIDLIKRSQQTQLLRRKTQQSTNVQDTVNTGNYFGEQRQVSELYNLPSSSASSIPSLAWKSSSINDVPIPTPNFSSAGNSNWQGPLDSYHQYYDPSGQDLFLPYMQQHFMQTQSSESQPATESDLIMDDFPDTSLLSEFLTENQPMSFEIMP